MRSWKRILATILVLTILAPMVAVGEGTGAEIVPEGQPYAASEEAAPEEAAPEGVEPDPQETVALELSENGAEAKASEGPAAQFHEITVDPAGKPVTFTMDVGDTVRIRVSDATVTQWKPAKKNIVSIAMGTDDAGQYADVKADAEVKKMKLTADITGHKKKKAAVNLIINNPYTPTGIAFREAMPASVPVGATINLPEMIALTPSYAVTTLTYRATGAAKATKDGVLTTKKAGKAKITVTASNNKKAKATFNLNVLANKVQNMSAKPAAGDYAAIAGGWTLWPLSVEVDKKGKVACQLYLLNATGEKSTKIDNMTLTLSAGTKGNIIAQGTFAATKAAVANNKFKAVKLTLQPTANMAGVFLPEHYGNGTLFFGINQDEVMLQAKKGRYGFIATRFPVTVLVKGITLTPASATVRPGESVTLTPVVVPAYADDPTVLWTSDNSAVATVDGGVVTGVADGTAVITAEAADGSRVKATCAITVDSSAAAAVPVTGIVIESAKVALSLGGSRTLSVTVSPENATNKAILWRSSDEAVATVKAGVVTAVGEGTAEITAEAADGSGVRSTCTVTVQGMPGEIVPVSEIDMKSDLTLQAGESFELAAFVLPVNATYQTLSWTSDRPDIARIEDGMVTGLCTGAATITAAAEDGSGVAATCRVSVASDFDLRDGVVVGYNGPGGYVEIPEADFAGNSIWAVGGSAFEANRAIQTAVIPEGVETINARAFADSSLQAVYLPDSLQSIDASAFDGVTGLTVYATKYSTGYDFTLAHNLTWGSAEAKKDSELIDFLDTDDWEKLDTSTGIDDIECFSLSTDGIEEADLLEAVDHFNRAQARLEGSTNKYVAVMEDLSQEITDLVSLNANSAVTVSDGRMTFTGGDGAFDFDMEGLGALSGEAELVSADLLTDNTVLVEFREGGNTVCMHLTETGLDVVNEAENNSFVKVKVDDPQLVSRAVAVNAGFSDSIISALKSVGNALQSLVTAIEKGLGRWVSYADEVVAGAEESMKWMNFLKSSADKGVPRAAKLLEGGKYEKAVANLVAAKALQGAATLSRATWKKLNLISDVTRIVTNFAETLEIQTIINHGHPTAEERERGDLVALSAVLYYNVGVSVPVYAIDTAQLLISATSKIDAITSLFTAFCGPAGLAVRGAVKLSVTAAKATVKGVVSILKQAGKEMLSDILKTAVYALITNTDKQIHEHTGPTPAPTSTPTPAPTRTPAPKPTRGPKASGSPLPDPSPRPDDKIAPDPQADYQMDPSNHGGTGGASGDIAIDAAHFPDPAFRAFIKSYCGDSEGILTNARRLGVQRIDLRDCPNAIQSLTGIKLFANLEYLIVDCEKHPGLSLYLNGMKSLEDVKIYHNEGDNAVREIDLRGCSALESFYCNKASALWMSGCTALTYLSCHNCDQASLNLAGCTALTHLYCSDCGQLNLNAEGCASLPELYVYDCNPISLNLAGCASLKSVDCRGGVLERIDLSGCSSLEILDCFENRLTELDLTSCRSLKELRCDGNYIKRLDVGGLTALEAVWCYDNLLESLNVAGCSHLNLLYCYNNDLTALDLTGCSALTKLTCQNNLIEALDVSPCVHLTELDCRDNRLAGLDVSHLAELENLGCNNNPMTALAAVGCAALGSSPGANYLRLENCPLEEVDLSGCASLRSMDFSKNPDLKRLNVSGCSKLFWLTINEYCPSIEEVDASNCTTLERLQCYNSALASIDLSGCTALQDVYLYNCELTSLELTDCAALQSLSVHDNLLDALDVHGQSRLKNLECNNNMLAELNLEGCTALELLSCAYNMIADLDLEGCTKLTYLSVNGNPLNSLNVSGTAIENLSCSQFLLTSLNARNCTALKQLWCSGNLLTALDVGGCTALEELWCSDNLLTALDVSGCAALRRLNCYVNQIEALDVTGCTALEELRCYDNRIAQLDLSRCANLAALNCGRNPLQALNVESCPRLESIYCYACSLSGLDVSKCTELKTLSCGSNQLASLDVGACTKLRELYCANNALTLLDVRKNKALQKLTCGNNRLTVLRVMDCAELVSLKCAGNRFSIISVYGCAKLTDDNIERDPFIKVLH